MGSSLWLHVDHANDPCEHNCILNVWSDSADTFSQLRCDVFAIAELPYIVSS